MTEETTTVETQEPIQEQIQEQVQTEPEVTLDDLYKESGIETQVAQPQKQAEIVSHETSDINVPDPYDIEAHKAFIKSLAQNQTALHQSLQEAQEKLAKKEQETLMAKLEEEISKASEFVSKESGIENSNLATFELSERARTDPKFKALWDGRNSSPQAKAAFTKALQVVSKDIGKKYEVRSDPTLIANRKALAASRQSSSTTTQEDKNDGWSGLTEAQFQQKWARMVSPNN